MIEACGEDPNFLAGRSELGERRMIRFAPKANAHMRHRKVFAHVVVDHPQHRLEFRRLDQLYRGAMHPLAERVVLLAELHQFPQPCLEDPGFLTQADDLALGKRYRPAAVRVRNFDFRQRFGMFFEEFRVILQVAGNVLWAHSDSFLTG